MLPRPPTPPLFPYTTLFRSQVRQPAQRRAARLARLRDLRRQRGRRRRGHALEQPVGHELAVQRRGAELDRKSTRLNSSHLGISYAVFCLKKKKNKEETTN